MRKHLAVLFVMIAQCCMASFASTQTLEAVRAKGDVNGDGHVNVIDAILAVNFILGTVNPAKEELCAADGNGDGFVNVLDVLLTVNVILSPDRFQFVSSCDELDCDDGNACTKDYCDPFCIQCVHTNMNSGFPCDDGDLCTENDRCVNGTCQGTPLNCDDGNPCTEDSCDPDRGCTHRERCCANGLDDDGDGGEDCSDGDCLVDSDEDGYHAVPCGGDLDDTDPDINPGADEVCDDGKDNDCDGATDCADSDCDRDEDHDTYRAMPCGDDCNDSDASVHPGAMEICTDGKDNDCDQSADCQDGDCLVDSDHDTYYATPCGNDCNDDESSIHPGATEACNGQDDDCDGATDEEGATGCTTYYRDNDQDGYGQSSDHRCLCVAMSPYDADQGGDLNDQDAAIYPGAPEICDDNRDNDQDGLTDCDDGDCSTNPLCGEGTGTDFTVCWIARLPRMDYVWGSANPAVEGWPSVGQTVTWHGVVKNWGTTSRSNVGYIWYLDDTAVDQGTLTIPARDTVAVEYSRAWDFTRRTLRLVIDPSNEIEEVEESNNELAVFTDAITVAFYVESSMYAYFHEHQHQLNVHSTCWENWAQRQVSRWNDMFESAVYPETPDGVLDRIRIDWIHVVPDGALPLAGGLPTNNPNLNDRTVDLQWGFPSEQLNSDFYADVTHAVDSNPFFYEGSLIHELGHARYLIDVYGFNVHDDGTGSTVDLWYNGTLVPGSYLMPFIAWDALYYAMDGLMHGSYTFVDRYSAAALNLITGHRAVLGNYNAPGNIGVFMNDLPAQNLLTLKDQNGIPLSGAHVSLYRSSGSPSWYGKHYADPPDIEFDCNAQGVIDLGHCPFAANSQIVHTYGNSNAVLLFRVEAGGKIGYAFLDISGFNLAYWRGETAVATHELTVTMH